MDAVYHILDATFFAFHTMMIAFNVFGWIWTRTRRANLICLGLTGFSWVGLGYWYGWGYCPCTDWHWQVRERIGAGPMPTSYLKFLGDSITGLNLDALWVDRIAVLVFAVAVVSSIAFNVRDARVARRRAADSQE